MKKALVLLFLIMLVLPFPSSAQMSSRPPAKISFDFIDADIKNVLRVLAEVAKKNIVIAEDVKGKVTLKLDNVSYDEAFDVILRGSDLAKVEEETIIRVMTVKKFDEERNRGIKERLEFLKEKEARQKLEEEFVTETVFINYADAAEVEKMVKGETSSLAKDIAEAAGKGAIVAAKPKGLLSPHGVVTLVKWNSALIIKDTKENVANIVKLIKEHDVAPQQVQIEARIVQATSTFSKELGIQWGARYQTRVRGRDVAFTGPKQVDSAPATGGAEVIAPTGNIGERSGFGVFPYSVNLPATMGPGLGGALGIYVGSVTDSFQLDVILSALEQKGLGKVISNPKVVTSENRPAKIAQGQQVPYQSSSAQLGTNTQFKDALLELEVTPHVVKDGNIRLTIRAKKDRPLFVGEGPPPIEKREAMTELLVKDGETAVLGGIYEITQDTSETGIPLLKDIPLLGWLFKNKTKDDIKTELLIFVTPTILKNLYTEKK